MFDEVISDKREIDIGMNYYISNFLIWLDHHVTGHVTIKINNIIAY